MVMVPGAEFDGPLMVMMLGRKGRSIYRHSAWQRRGGSVNGYDALQNVNVAGFRGEKPPLRGGEMCDDEVKL